MQRGDFVPLGRILDATIPYITNAVSNYDHTARSAGLVVKAGVLACVAGDGWANVRPGQQRFARGPTAPGGRCLDPGCPRRESCPGTTIAIQPDGSVCMSVVHCKNGAVSTLTAAAHTATAAVLSLLVSTAAPALRDGTASHDGVFVRDDGKLYEKNGLSAVVKSQLKAVGLPHLNARKVRG